ncbi:MAG: cobalamin receptor, partial [Rikenellaceae bacterium]
MLSYTYSRSENNIGDQWRPYIYDAPHDVNILAIYDVLNRGKKKHTLSLNVGYKTGLPYILSNETYPNCEIDSYYRHAHTMVYYPKYANTRLTDFFRADINYSMEKKLPKGSRIWQISILNASAHNNPYVIYKTRTNYRAMTLIP